MSTKRIYSLPVEITDWKFDGQTDIRICRQYTAGSEAMLALCA